MFITLLTLSLSSNATAAPSEPETVTEPQSSHAPDIDALIIDTLVYKSDTFYLTTDGRVLRYRTETESEDMVLVEEVSAVGGVSLFKARGAVWVERMERVAEPLSLGLPVIGPLPLPGSSRAPHTTKTPSTATPSAGKVLSSSQGEIVINLGRSDGIEPGDAIKVIGRVETSIPSIDGSASQGVVEADVAQGWVTVVEESRALVSITRGSRAQPDDRVEVVDEDIPRIQLAPEPIPGIREFGFKVRPLLALDTVGVAFINEVWMRWTFDSPWYAEARLSPLGIGWSQDGNPLSVAALGSAGFDSRWFSVGLGAGWSMLNTDASNYGYSYDMAVAESGFSNLVEFEDVAGAPSIVQAGRLGAEDGIHLTIRNTFILTPKYEWTSVACSSTSDENSTFYESYYNYCGDYEEDGKEFVFGGIAMRLAVPTGPRTDLVFDWGTGRAGATWVEAGVDAWLRGNGDVGSFGVEVAAGFGSLSAEPNDEWISLYGPMVSGGARWRF